MSPSEDFYELLSSLLQQTAQNPDAPPVIPLNRWPTGSPEQRLLEDLQAALNAMQTSNQNHLSQTNKREQQYQSIFETAGDGLIFIDLKTGLVLEANPAACTMYGYARDEFIGLNPVSFIHPDSSQHFNKYIQAVQSQGVSLDLQIHKRREAHSSMWN